MNRGDVTTDYGTSFGEIIFSAQRCPNCEMQKAKTEKLHRDMQKREGAMVRGEREAIRLDRERLWGRRLAYEASVAIVAKAKTTSPFPWLLLGVTVGIALWGWLR